MASYEVIYNRKIQSARQKDSVSVQKMEQFVRDTINSTSDDTGLDATDIKIALQRMRYHCD